jgi:DNA-binding transcriptional regulator YiaG
MKTINIKCFAGLSYVDIKGVPVKSTQFGDVINMASIDLERKVSVALIENRVPIRGLEFRLLKSAMKQTNDQIADTLGVHRNTVLKWGKNLEERLPKAYEMLVRLLAADLLKIKLPATIRALSADAKAKAIKIRAA